MTQYELYTFILCLIVFVALTALFAGLMTYIVKLWVRLIRGGEEDETIVKEYEAERGKSKKSELAAKIFSSVICALFCLCFVCAIYLRATEHQFFDRIPSLQVVKSGSMSYKYEENGYLYTNQLNDQIGTFDLIVVHPLPPEDELELYDIVVYEVNEKMIVHRIVGIEGPNAGHPEDRYFLLQGDAVESPDKFPVRYAQMKGIYRGQHIPFVGSFISFLQSPAGWLCILLILFAMVSTPLVEKKLAEEKRRRLTVLGVFGPDPNGVPWEGEPVLEEPQDEPMPLPPEKKDAPRMPPLLRFRLRKGAQELFACLYQAEQIRVHMDRRTLLATVTVKGKQLDVRSDTGGKKRLNILLRRDGTPVARLVLRDRLLRMYLSLSHLTDADGELMPTVTTVKNEDTLQLYFRLRYPQTGSVVRTLILTVRKNGPVTIEEEEVS